MSSSANDGVAVSANHGPRIELRRSCRLGRSQVSAYPLLLVDQGVVALESTLSGGRRQVLDFFMAGDVIPTSVAVTALSLTVRAVTAVTLSCRDAASSLEDTGLSSRGQGLLHLLCSHLSRRNLHQVMIGQLDADSRVASFLIALALRTCGFLRDNLTLALPMSRNDIADYLAINSDTLSRVMMRYETSGLLHRLDRHTVKLIDVEGIGQRTALRACLVAAHSAANGAVGVPAVSTLNPATGARKGRSAFRSERDSQDTSKQLL